MRLTKLNIIVLDVVLSIIIAASLSVSAYAIWQGSGNITPEDVKMVRAEETNPSSKYIIFKGIRAVGNPAEFRFTPLIPAASDFDQNAHYYKKTGADYSYEGKLASAPDGFPTDYYVDESPEITAYAAVGYTGLVAELQIPDKYNDKPVKMIGSYGPVAKANKSFANDPVIADIVISPNVEKVRSCAFMGLKLLRRVEFRSHILAGRLPKGTFPAGYYTDKNGTAPPGGGLPDGSSEYFIENYVPVSVRPAPDGFPTDYFYQKDDGAYAGLAGNIFTDEQGASSAQSYENFPEGFYIKTSGDATPAVYTPAGELNYFKKDGYVSVGILPATTFPAGYYVYGYKELGNSSTAPPGFPRGYYTLENNEPYDNMYVPAEATFRSGVNYYVRGYIPATESEPDGKTLYYTEKVPSVNVEIMAFADCGNGKTVTIINPPSQIPANALTNTEYNECALSG